MTDVTAYCAISGESLAHATTDQDGYYLLEIYFTSVAEIDLFDLKVYPNPFAGRADVLFTTNVSGEYILECVAVDGSVIMSQSKTLAANQRVRAQIENPGRTGIYYLVIHSPQGRQAIRLMHLGSEGSPSMSIHAETAAKTEDAPQWGDDQFLLKFQADGHHEKDTLLYFDYFMEVDVEIGQIPDVVNSTYELHVYDDLGDVQGASVMVFDISKSNNHNQDSAPTGVDDILFSGTTNAQGVYFQNYEVLEWSWEGQPTIRNLENLYTTIESDQHEPYERTDTYQQNLEIEVELERIIEDESATITGSVTSLPHNLPPITTIKGKHQGETIETTTTDANGNYTLSMTMPEGTSHVDLVYTSDSHEQKDTTVTFTNHEIHKVLNQIPDTVNSTYNLHVFDDLGDVQGASVTVFNASTSTNHNLNSGWAGDEILFSGTTNQQGIFTQNYDVLHWYWSNQPTITSIENLHTIVETTYHLDFNRVDFYQQHLQIDADLERITGSQTAETDITLRNHPMDHLVYGASYQLLNEHGETIGEEGITGEDGKITASLLRDYELVEGDTLFSYHQIIIPISREHHHSDTLFIDFGDVQETFTLMQIQYDGSATLSVDLMSHPLDYAPDNVDVFLWFNQQIIAQDATQQGSATIENIGYTYYLMDDLVLKKIGGEPITQVDVELSHPSHQDAIFTIDFMDEMFLDEVITQDVNQVSAQLSGQVEDAQTGEPVFGAQVEIINTLDDGVLFDLQTDSQGGFQHEFSYLQYTNGDNPEGNAAFVDNQHVEHVYGLASKEYYYDFVTEYQPLAAMIDYGIISLAPQPVSKTLNFTAKFLQVTGDPQHPQNQYEITFGDQVHTFAIGENNEINVNITADIYFGEDQVIIRNLPYQASPNTPIDNDIVMIAYQNRPAFERAFASNQMYANAKYSNDPRNYLEIDLDQINNKHNLEILSTRNYFVNGEDFTQTQTQADTIFMNTVIPYQLLGFKSSGISCQWEPYTQNGTLIDKVQFVHVKAEIHTNTPMPDFVTEPWDYAINLTKNASYRRDGQPTLEYEVIEFDSFDDPEYQEIANRTPPFRNTVRIYSNNTITMASNGTGFISGGIISRGNAQGPPTNLSERNTSEEVLEATYSMANSPASGSNSATFMLSYDTDGNIQTNEMGYTLIQFRQHIPKNLQYTIAPPVKQPSDFKK